MNKENSFGIQNESSTQLNDTNSYSTRRKHLSQLKSESKGSLNMVPYRYEKAAVIIQRYWRFRMAVGRKVYVSTLAEIEAQNNLLTF